MSCHNTLKYRVIFGALLVFCFSAVLTAMVFLGMQRAREAAGSAQTSSISQTCAASLQQIGDAMLHSAYTIEILLQERRRENSGTLRRENILAVFKTAADGLMALYPNMYAVALTADGVPTWVYPPQSPVHTWSPPSEECRQPEISAAPAVDVPFDPVRKEHVIVGRFPLHLKDTDAPRPPWGILCMTFRFPDLPASALLEGQGYAWELRRPDPETGRTQILAASTTPIRKRPQESPVQFPGETWTFTATPPPCATPIPSILAGAALCLLCSLAAAWSLHLLEKKKHLERISCTDPLTGLPNRRLLLRRLQRMITGKPKSAHFVAVCYVDLDDFKEINDVLGHKSGDLLLTEFAGRLNTVLQNGELAARIGGDEFVLLLDVGDREECEQRLQALSERLRPPFRTETEMRNVHASIGVALWPEHGESADQLLRQADQAMYRAKNSDRERICFSCRGNAT